MGGGHWRLGIDIQPAQLVAVALSARRDGIQLRGWWRLPLTVDPDRDGLSPSLPATLTTLRARLPRRLSVRAAFPAESGDPRYAAGQHASPDPLAAASPAVGAGRASADVARTPVGL
nr:hypothetical protein [Edwardsiella ictaluri]